jgi:F420-non-reducing hydrogenase iron-sulfur subunit
MILEHLGINPARFRVQWVSAAESIRFVEVITAFDNHIRNMGVLGQKENLNLQALAHKLRAAKMAVEGKALRMAFAKQAKQMKENGTYGEFPSKEKLMETFMNEMALNETLLFLKEKERSASEISDLLKVPVEQVMSYIETLQKRNLWKGELREVR